MHVCVRVLCQYMLCQCSDSSQCNHFEQSSIVESVNNKKTWLNTNFIILHVRKRKGSNNFLESLTFKPQITMVYINRGELNQTNKSSKMCVKRGKGWIFVHFTLIFITFRRNCVQHPTMVIDKSIWNILWTIHGNWIIVSGSFLVASTFFSK